MVPDTRLQIGSFVTVFSLLFATACGQLSDKVESNAEARVEILPAATRGVGALGRIEPLDEIYRISAPYFDGRPSLVETLAVAEGEWVNQGQVLATLNFRSSFQARVEEAESRIPVMEARVRLAQEGPKEGDVAAQQAEIARWESMLELERSDHARYQALHDSADVSSSVLDSKTRAVENAEKMLRQSRQRLASIRDVRQSGVDLAEAELQSARASVARARADLALTTVKSPLRAQVLKIHARAGEEVGPAGLLELGQTYEMWVVAEVYETDVSQLRVGGRATVSGAILDADIEGTVQRIGWQVEKNEVLPLDPTEFADARVIKVYVRLDDSEPVAGLIHGRVSVRFQR